jgi:hypothetical protein
MIDRNDHVDLYPNTCYQDPAFRCEEITCKSITGMESSPIVACGDGECYRARRRCSNKRDSLLEAAMWMLSPDKSNDVCWLAMACLTMITDQVQHSSCSEFCINNTCSLAIVRSCPHLLEFPAKSVLFGHVHFIYMTNQTLTTRFPEYICYDKQLCTELHLPLHSINGPTCAHVH